MFAHANTILLYGKLFEEPQSFEIVMYNHFTFYGRFTLHFVKAHKIRGPKKSPFFVSPSNQKPKDKILRGTPDGYGKR